ncbi:unnamed protein product [Nippostrongylus brasiliensis]|uniref:Col_cuticle_N domain-containing protein n=1 Tax=Nippostrongylus brasiliensis TaxID=27835 RepID=A0A0N4YII8_NIPBR|nr:unnamed protein product [Nippostrongylus brasiliensis]
MLTSTTKPLYFAISTAGVICLGAVLSFVCLLLDIDKFRGDFLRSSDEYRELSSRVWGDIVREVDTSVRERRSNGVHHQKVLPVVSDFECPTGPAGLPGNRGEPGEDAPPGVPGQKGADGMRIAVVHQYSNQCVACPQGPRGPPGPNGPPGHPGREGVNGYRGRQGAMGRPGATGLPGPAGAPGPRGEDAVDGLPGAPGAVGPDALYCPCPKREQIVVDASIRNQELERLIRRRNSERYH